MTVEEFQQMADRAYYIRGLVLNESIYLEHALEYYIATHYCGDNEVRDKMIEQFLTTDVSFRGKVSTFIRLIKEANKGWLSQNPEIPDNLDKIFKARNILAHEVLDTSPFGRQQYERHKLIHFTKLFKTERNVFSDEYVKELRTILGNTSNKIALLLPGFSEQPFPSGNS